jgi:aspartyl-tRNA(Asn)/glutamyl-tRNA(Gln) amidotransferase subunit B
MEKGSLRVDANISIRPTGSQALGTKTELKNMNSFANVERALEVERNRQIALIESGGKVTQQSMAFNAATGEVRAMRSKEESHDYRYFPDPDLPPLVLTRLWIERQHAALPELPDAKRDRLMTVVGLSGYDAGVIAAERPIADYFEAVVAAGADGKSAANWIMTTAMTGYNETGTFGVVPARLVELIRLVSDNVVSLQAAKRIYTELPGNGDTPRAVADRLGLIQVGDADALGAWVDEVLAANPKEVERYRAGEAKLMGFLTGQVMKKSGGKADPKAVQPVLLQKLNS